MDLNILKEHPFHLDDKGVEWVRNTRESMTLEEKIGQLFFLIGFSAKKRDLTETVRKFSPGGMMYRPGPAKKVTAAHKVLQEESRIPMLLAANLEAGADGLMEEGTFFGHSMEVAASDDDEQAYRLGFIAAKEAASVGGNMAFAPIVDINFNFRNPITNIRSFGDDPERVARMGAAYIRGAQACNASVTIKHFPGDGVDGRDHHLTTTYNSLSVDDWMKSFGHVYRTCIDQGARGLMVGHIGFPAWIDKTEGPDHPSRSLPATLSPRILKDLLRDELGYRGVTITDASLMTGFGEQGRRKDLVPATVAAGCDMLLFTRNTEEDFTFMMEGYKNGIISDERLNEAVTRILALKASQGLYKKSVKELVPGTFSQMDRSLHAQWAGELADKSVTLVKDEQNLLPLNREKIKKVAVIFNGNNSAMDEVLKGAPGIAGFFIRLFMGLGSLFKKKKLKPHQQFIKELKDRGIDAFEYNFGNVMTLFKDMNNPLDKWCCQFDLIIYFNKWETQSNQTSLQVNYKAMGFDAPWFIHEVPTMLVSVANPYHGYDMPMIKTVINAYSPNENVYAAVADKITGISSFKGISPVRLDFKEFSGKLPD